MNDMSTQIGANQTKPDASEVNAEISKQATELIQQVSSLKDQLKRINLECDDLRVVRQCNNQELITLESQRHQLTLQV